MKTKKKTLREIAKDLEGTRRSTSPSDLADRIMAAIPAADREFYLREALGVLAISFTTDFRRADWTRVVKRSRGEAADPTGKPKVRTQVTLTPEGEEVSGPSPEWVKYMSAKQAIIKSEWEKFLENNLPTDNGYIRVADADVKAVQRAALIRRGQGDANYAEAKKYDNLAAVMLLKNAATVGLLTADDVRGML